MLDAEIYVDWIADMRINDLNAVLQTVRQMVLMQQGETQKDLYLRTLGLAQVQEDEYFGHVNSDDLKLILWDTREADQREKENADRRKNMLDMVDFNHVQHILFTQSCLTDTIVLTRRESTVFISQKILTNFV